MPLESLEASLARRPGVPLEIDEPARQAAVALVFRPGPDLLFIRRADNPRDLWSGHIALPGGRVDPGDDNALSAVRREVSEEVGIDLSGAVLLGQLDQIISPPMRPRIIVSPFVFVLGHDPEIKVDRTEVAYSLWFSLQRLQADEGRGRFMYHWDQVDHDLPRVDLDGERIWGMTLRILDEMLARLRDPA